MLNSILNLFHRPPAKIKGPAKEPTTSYWQSASTLSDTPYKFELSKSRKVITITNTRGDVRSYTVRELRIYADSPYPPVKVLKMFRAALEFVDEAAADNEK